MTHRGGRTLGRWTTLLALRPYSSLFTPHTYHGHLQVPVQRSAITFSKQTNKTKKPQVATPSPQYV